jgi:hypothetical protein
MWSLWNQRERSLPSVLVYSQALGHWFKSGRCHRQNVILTCLALRLILYITTALEPQTTTPPKAQTAAKTT